MSLDLSFINEHVHPFSLIWGNVWVLLGGCVSIVGGLFWLRTVSKLAYRRLGSALVPIAASILFLAVIYLSVGVLFGMSTGRKRLLEADPTDASDIERVLRLMTDAERSLSWLIIVLSVAAVSTFVFYGIDKLFDEEEDQK